MSTVPAVTRPAVLTHHGAPAATPRTPTPRPSPDSFIPGLAITTLEAKLQRAQDLMAFRLGSVRAAIFTAPAQNLSDAARASKQPELMRAGKALKKSNEAQVAATFRREQLEAQVLQRPADGKLIRELDAAREREVSLTREVRGDVRDVQRLLSSVDVDTLAKIETPLHGFVVPAANRLEGALAQVKALREELASRR